VRALGTTIANQRAKSNDEVLALPHTILQKMLSLSFIIKAQELPMNGKRKRRTSERDSGEDTYERALPPRF
jgi:hypothetical protein